jgi:hypothetical protein
MLRYYPNSLKFQVAISFSDDSSKIAEDIYRLLSESGIIAYNYKFRSDITKGVLEDKIEEIYTSSDLNVMVWNDSYSKKGEDAVVSVEKETIYKRHIKNNEPESLITIINNFNIEKCFPSNRFNRITYHCLSDIGLFELRNIIIQRLIDAYSILDKDTNLKIIHPPTEKLNRGALSFCKFKINKDYEKDARWNRLADVLVDITHSDIPYNTNLNVYLLPSGRVTTLLSHSQLLKTQKMSLDLKRKFTKTFIKNHLDREFTGYLFFSNAKDIMYPHVYSIAYDDHLNNSLANK